ERAAHSVFAKLGTNVKPLHLADRLSIRMHGHTPGELAVPVCEQDRIVVAGQTGDLRIEVLEREIDAGGCRVFEEERAHRSHVRRALHAEHHTSSEPRSTVTARPPSLTRSPSRRTRTTPPRGDAWYATISFLPRRADQ